MAELAIGPLESWGLSWGQRPADRMERTGHALVDRGQIWLIDPIDGPGLDARLGEAGRVVAVVRLLDRHNRDGAAIAERHRAPLITHPSTDLAGAPFVAISLVTRRRWNEFALWWAAHRLLVVPEALGTGRFFRVGDNPVGVHPALRLTPPRRVVDLNPAILLTGHGPPLIGEQTGSAISVAVSRSRRDIPRWLGGLPSALRGPRGAS